MALASADAARHMDGIYRRQRHIYDLSRRWFLLGRMELIDRLDVPANGHVLEVACGTAWNLIRTADRYPASRLYGFDISSEMLHTASRSIDQAGLRDRISLAQADATGFNTAKLFGQEKFDRVFISYALSMIPNWPRVIEAASDILSEKGELHIIDFGPCEQYPAIFRSLLLAWLDRFSVTPRRDFETVLNAHAKGRGRVCESTSLYRDYAFYAVLKRQR